MLGHLLSSAIKIATLPVDVVEVAADAAVGGTGNREALKEAIPLPLPSQLRDQVAQAAEEIDE